MIFHRYCMAGTMQNVESQRGKSTKNSWIKNRRIKPEDVAIAQVDPRVALLPDPIWSCR